MLRFGEYPVKIYEWLEGVGGRFTGVEWERGRVGEGRHFEVATEGREGNGRVSGRREWCWKGRAAMRNAAPVEKGTIQGRMKPERGECVGSIGYAAGCM